MRHIVLFSLGLATTEVLASPRPEIALDGQEIAAGTYQKQDVSNCVVALTRFGVPSWKRKKLGRRDGGIADLVALDGGYVASVAIANETFNLVVDTGSADLWVAKKDYSCVSDTGRRLPDYYCGFSKTYNGTFDPIPDLHFHIEYGGGEYLLGSMASLPVTIGGITVPNQTVAIVDKALFPEAFSGILGLAYPLATSAFKGPESNASNDNRNAITGNHVLYNSTAMSMISSKLISPMFSLALSRNDDDSPGGYLAFGSLGPAPTQGPWATTSILKENIFDSPNGDILTKEFSYYTIGLQAIAFSFVNMTSRLTTAKRAAINLPMMIDSGTTLTYLPDELASPILDAYNPPAFYDPDQGAYFAPCSATPPLFSLQVGGVNFTVDRADMLLQGPGYRSGVDCITGIQGVSAGLLILGITFLNNVKTVFDIEKSEIRLAQRVPY